MEKTKSITRMLQLANRLNQIVEEMKCRKDLLLAEQLKKAA
ncbi:hypothetical protein [Klebsiella michiganensis]|nr:hypothetical protein [Klebsiella michiganensis]